MQNHHIDLLVTGIGITSAVGQGKAHFSSSLMNGQHAFRVMERPGRQKDSSFIGAEIQTLSISESISKRLLRRASFSAQVAMVTLQEAWEDANMDAAKPSRVGLVIGGSNVQQRELLNTFQTYSGKPQFINPAYGLSFMDSDLCGLCTDQFGIKGIAYTTGGASASGQLSIIRAIQEIVTGQVDICIAMGALMDISYLECQALRSLGAMGTDRYASEPGRACRPFDKGSDGFIYGESCGALIIESIDSALSRQVNPYALISGWAVNMDGNCNPNPTFEGEVNVVKKVLEKAGLTAQQIDYVNPHGTGSVIGDETELSAIIECGLSHAFINATKSITGHGLSAAGAVEAVATLLQMKESRLHPTRNLDKPIVPALNWVKDQSVPHSCQNALSLSIGFGGINTAICFTKI